MIKRFYPKELVGWYHVTYSVHFFRGFWPRFPDHRIGTTVRKQWNLQYLISKNPIEIGNTFFRQVLHSLWTGLGVPAAGLASHTFPLRAPAPPILALPGHGVGLPVPSSPSNGNVDQRLNCSQQHQQPNVPTMVQYPSQKNFCSTPGPRNPGSTTSAGPQPIPPPTSLEGGRPTTASSALKYAAQVVSAANEALSEGTQKQNDSSSTKTVQNPSSDEPTQDEDNSSKEGSQQHTEESSTQSGNAAQLSKDANTSKTEISQPVQTSSTNSLATVTPSSVQINDDASKSTSTSTTASNDTPKRLHVSNIPFR